jgi:hypothetical protein
MSAKDAPIAKPLTFEQVKAFAARMQPSPPLQAIEPIKWTPELAKAWGVGALNAPDRWRTRRDWMEREATFWEESDPWVRRWVAAQLWENRFGGP